LKTAGWNSKRALILDPMAEGDRKYRTKVSTRPGVKKLERGRRGPRGGPKGGGFVGLSRDGRSGAIYRGGKMWSFGLDRARE